MEIGLLALNPKALYMTYYGIGDRGLRNSALKLIEETELNALVIDVKGDRGVVTYKTEVPFANQIGAQKLIIVKDVRELVRTLKERGIYTIARIVVFKDNLWPRPRPDWRYRPQREKSGETGRIWSGLTPSRQEVWEYNIRSPSRPPDTASTRSSSTMCDFPDATGLQFSPSPTPKRTG